MRNICSSLFASVIILGLTFNLVQAQVTSKDQLLGQRNVVTTSVPFLTIAPDARSAALGEAGVALKPDANGAYWNAAKMAFIESDAGISISATPWLRELVPDVWIYYLSGYKRIGEKQRSTLSGSIRHFTLGEIQFTDQVGSSLGNYEPYETAISGNYATQLSKQFSVGVGLRFIVSDLAKGQYSGNQEIKPGIAGSGDIGVYYKNEIDLGGREWQIALGGNISNLGSKISYTTKAERDYIPTSLRLGAAFTNIIDDYNSITFLVDINKLLVPTPQWDDSTQRYYRKDVNVLQGVFQSVGDAPGGFQEELNELMYSVGFEYWYDKQFALRAGYFNEHKNKGGRNFGTIGAGLKMNKIGVDAAYLIPLAQRHPLQGTIRFSVAVDLGLISTD